MSNASHKLHEARGLVGAVAVDRAREMHRVVGDESDGTSFDPDQRRHHPGAEVAAYLEHRAGIGERLDDRANVVNAKSIFGDDRAQQTLIGAYPVANFSLKVR